MATYYIPSSSGWKANGGGIYNTYLRIKAVTSYNVSTNQTTVTFSMQAQSLADSGHSSLNLQWHNLKYGSLVCNGTTLQDFTGSNNWSVRTNGDSAWENITGIGSTPDSWTKVIQHNDDGTASINITLNFRLYGTYNGKDYNSYFADRTGSLALSEPRMSDVSASNGYFGDTIPITVTRKNTSFTHTVRVTCIDRSQIIATGSTASSLSWTPDVATYAPLLTNAMSTTATVYCDTCNGSQLIGTKSVTITMSLKVADVSPSLSLTIEDAITSPKDQTKTCLQYYGAFVATKSKYKITTVPTLAYSTSVASTSITANGATYSSSPATTSLISSASQNTVTGRITDGRGQQASSTQNTTVLAYDMPRISSMAARRCKSDGTYDDTGAYCRVDYSVIVTALNNHNCKDSNDQFRTDILKVGIKRTSDSGWIYTDAQLDAYTKTSYIVVSANTEYSHEVMLVLKDDFNTSSAVMSISSAYVLPLNFMTGGKGIGIGKVSEVQYAVDLGANWTLKKNGQQVPLSEFSNDVFYDPYPVGSIYMSVDSTSPASLFGGSWQRIQDTFLLAAGTTYSAGGTGGSATMAHTHNHDHTHALGGAGYAKLTAWSTDNNRVTYKEVSGVASWTSNYRFTSPSTPTSYSKASTYGVELGGTTGYTSGQTTGAASNDNNMPPYLAVYVWKRIG